MVRKLSEAAGEDLPLMAVQEAPCGCTLRGHWENGKVDKMLEEIPWDYVVLQEQSQRPSFSRSHASRKCIRTPGNSMRRSETEAAALCFS